MSDAVQPQDDLFGYYCTIEMKRYDGSNEWYQHKIIGRYKSNAWVEVPIQGPPTATVHAQSEDVINVICCGPVEEHVYRVRLKDVTNIHSHDRAVQRQRLATELLALKPAIKQIVHGDANDTFLSDNMLAKPDQIIELVSQVLNPDGKV